MSFNPSLAYSIYLINQETRRRKEKWMSKKEEPNFDDFIGYQNVKDFFYSSFINDFIKKDIQNYTHRWRAGWLFYGSIFVDLQYFATAFANEMHVWWIYIDCIELEKENFNEVDNLLDEVEGVDSVAIILDNFEWLQHNEDDADEPCFKDAIINKLKIIMEKKWKLFYKKPTNVFLMALSNYPWEINSVFLTDLGIENNVMLPLPDEQTKIELFNFHLKEIPKEDDFNLQELVKFSEIISEIDIFYFCEQLKETINKTTDNKNVKDGEVEKISNKDIEIIKQNFKTSIDLEELEMIIKW